jgi:uncharacterized lipoprotein YmbA
MGLRTLKWMLSFAALSLTSCASAPADSYCVLYTPVIAARGDGNIQATPGVKRRLLLNEKLYRSCPAKG